MRPIPAPTKATGEASASPVSNTRQAAQTSTDAMGASYGGTAIVDTPKALFNHYRHRWLSRVARDPTLPGAAVRVAVLLWELTNAERRCGWPSLLYIAEQLDMDKSTAVRSLNTLGSRGWITKTRRGGRHRSNEYRITFGSMEDNEAA